MSTVDTLSKRCLNEIAMQLRSAIHFLDEYQLLVSQDYPQIAYSSQLIQTKKDCYWLCIHKSDDAVRAFMNVFTDCSVYSQLQVISTFTFKLVYSVDLLESVDGTKALITDLLRTIESQVIALPLDEVKP